MFLNQKQGSQNGHQIKGNLYLQPIATLSKIQQTAPSAGKRERLCRDCCFISNRIGWESGASFQDLSESKAKESKTNAILGYFQHSIENVTNLTL